MLRWLVAVLALAAGCWSSAPAPPVEGGDIHLTTAPVPKAAPAPTSSPPVENDVSGGTVPAARLGGATQLALGMSHSCALVEGGAVYCWGDGNWGQLGRGSRDASGLPVRVTGIADAVAIDAGVNHTCALLRGGGVACWGGNDSAELGDGTTVERLSPVRVLDLDDAVAISLGMDTSCALRRGGAVVCWGRKLTERASGVGSRNDHTPQPIAGLTGVSRLAVGLLHICALRGDERELVCVGLDHAIHPPRGYQARLAVESTGLSGVDDIAAGSGFTCFSLSGDWRCWGANHRGQLGRPGTEAIHADSAGPVLELPAARRIVAGDAEACALDAEGAVRCWGRGERQVYPIDGLPAVRELALSPLSHERHACAIVDGGGVICWGANGGGQLGDGTVTARDLPVSVKAPRSTELVPAAKKAPPRGTPFLADELAAGWDETCARRGGEVWCWGVRHERTFADPLRYRRAPERVDSLGDVVQIAAGFGFMCARERDGAVRCWGENTRRELGDGTAERRLAPVPVRGVRDATSLFVGGSRACALGRDGGLTCWGDGDAPRKLELAGLPGSARIRSGELGAGHLCVLLRSGRVSCRGANGAGQLGSGEGGCRPDPTDRRCSRPKSRCRPRRICDRSDVFVAVEGLREADALALGGAFSCAVYQSGRQSGREGGQVACWGQHAAGQLGVGPDQASPALTPLEIPELTGVVELAAAGDHACARRRDGHVFCWGQNVFGELGDRTTQRRPSTSPVFGVYDAVEISAGFSHTCLRRADGAVWCWGNNADGSLGIGEDERLQPIPRPVLQGRAPGTGAR